MDKTPSRPLTLEERWTFGLVAWLRFLSASLGLRRPAGVRAPFRVAIFRSFFDQLYFDSGNAFERFYAGIAARVSRAKRDAVETKQVNAEPLVVDQQTAARMLNVNVSTLRRWHREGRGPRMIRISRLVRYRPKELERFLKDLEHTASKWKRRRPLPPDVGR